jgi:hypothetical protein
VSIDVIVPAAVSERYGSPPYADCVPASAAMLAAVASHRPELATAAEARALRIDSGVPHAEGLGPADVTVAYRRRYGWQVPPFSGSPAALLAALRAGAQAAVHVIYGRVPPALHLDPGFDGGHCVEIRAEGACFRWLDPMCYPGSGYAGAELSAQQLLACLNVSGGVALATVLMPNQFAAPHVRVAVGTFLTYTVRQDVATKVYRAIGSSRRFARIGTVIPVTADETPVQVSGSTVPMRQVTSGTYDGLWVNAHGVLPFSF